jgi:hypothetical protein
LSNIFLARILEGKSYKQASIVGPSIDANKPKRDPKPTDIILLII